MFRVCYRNRLFACKSSDAQGLYQAMIGMRVHSHSTMRSIGSYRNYFKRISRRMNLASQRIQFLSKIINSIALFQAQVCHVINAARLAGKAGSRDNHRDAIDYHITSTANATQWTWRVRDNATSVVRNANTHAREYFQQR